MAWTLNTPFLRRLALCGYFMAITLLAGIAPARAESTFLLQLGTFDSESLAKEKWEEVKSKNADVVGGLSLHVAEVALPPSDTVSYRAQIGPVASREQASGICTTLQSRSVDCYVIETAMLDSERPTETQAQQAPAPAMAEAPVPAPAPMHKARPSAEEDTAHADDPDYVPPPVDSGPVYLSSDSTAGTEAPAAMPAPAAPAEPQTAAAPPPPPPPVVAPPAPPVMAASDEEEPQPKPVKRHRHHYNLAGSPSDKNRVVPGRGPRFLDAPTSGETEMAAVAPPPPPPAPPAEKPGFFGRLFGASEPSSTPPPPPPAPAPAEMAQSSTGVVGNVNVAEAVRVPLSTGEEPKHRAAPVTPAVHPLGGYPSESTAKSFWAQISYFRDEGQAMNFFRQFSGTYPQFSEGVRVRITRPFGISSSTQRVSLRVGPFAGTQDVHAICGAANRWHARCTVVRDLGASAPITTTSLRPLAMPHEDHVMHETAGAEHSYWAQLGTYQSSEDAWDVWKELKTANRKALGHAHPSVTIPAKSSAHESSYRLRVGPYPTQEAANTLCNRLQNSGANCLVINER